MASNSQPVCAVCGKPAHSKCTGCETDSKPRHYCGTACQKEDWPRHKINCKVFRDLRLEKVLARAAGLIQQAYYEFRENTWETPIIKIEDREDALIFQDGDMHKKTKYFLTFPRHMGLSERTKAAMLCAWVCNEPLAFMHDLVADLLGGKLDMTRFLWSTNLKLQGFDIEVEEVRLNLGRIPRKITYYSPNGGSDDNWPKYFHEVFRITSLRNKKQWAIDISGAQYGITQAFWDWEGYAKEYTVKVQAADAFGSNVALIRKLRGIPGNPSMCYGVIEVVAEHMNQLFKNWAKDRSINLSSLLTMSDDDFRQTKDELLQFVNDAVREFLRANSFDEEFHAAKEYERQFPGMSALQCKMATAEPEED